MSPVSGLDPAGRQKAELRKALLQGRPQSSAGLTSQLVELVRALGAKQVGCYAAKSDEPDTIPFLDWARESQIEIYTPTVNEHNLVWHQYLGELKADKFGIGVSLGEPKSVTDLDLVFVPALGATSSGGRLGRGGGFFDRELGAARTSAAKSIPVFVAIVFDSELLSSLPMEPHDEPVDFVVTPEKTIRTKSDLAN